MVKWRKLELLRGLWIVVWQKRWGVLACADFTQQSLKQTENDESIGALIQVQALHLLYIYFVDDGSVHITGGCVTATCHKTMNEDEEMQKKNPTCSHRYFTLFFLCVHRRVQIQCAQFWTSLCEQILSFELICHLVLGHTAWLTLA